MNPLIVMVIFATISNIIGTPITSITNEELMDGKYICEDVSALKLSDYSYNDLLRPMGYVNADFPNTSTFINELFYNMFLKTFKVFKQSLARQKSTEQLPEEIAGIFAKRNLDSIGGGHLIKRADDNKLRSD